MAEYYADFKNGNDGNTGGSGDPWKTITYALTQMGNGDTLYLRGDSADIDTYYREDDVTCALDNATIVNDTGHTPAWVASEELTSWSKTAGRTNVYDATLAGAVKPGAYNSTQVLAPVNDLATCDSTTNSFYYSDPTLYVNIGGGVPTSIEAIDGVEWLCTLSGDSITIDGIIFQWMFPALQQSGSNGTIQNCTLRYQAREATATHLILRSIGDDNTVSNCAVTGLPNGSGGGILLQATTTANRYVIDGCTINLGGNTVQFSGGTGHEIKNCTIDGGNRIIDFTSGASGAAHHNTITDFLQYGIYIQTNGTVNIYKNLLYLDTGAGAKQAIRMISNPTVNLYHNDFYRLDHSGSNNGYGIIAVPTTAGMTVTARNNAFHTMRYGIAFTDVGYSPTWDLDYNGFYNIATANFSNIAAEDQGTHNVTDDPLFTDLSSYDFTLQEESPYRGAGVYVSGVSEYSPPTIGRYEYSVGEGVPSSGWCWGFDMGLD